MFLKKKDTVMSMMNRESPAFTATIKNAPSTPLYQNRYEYENQKY